MIRTVVACVFDRDPVAAAVGCLLERIRLLEREVGIHGGMPGGKELEDECLRCDAQQVCDHHPTPTA